MFRVGDKVTYQGEVYYVVEGPIMATVGPIFSISTAPPPIHGVRASELSPA